MNTHKQHYLAFLPMFAALVLLSGCSEDEYTDVNYGGSFLIDSLTVGFIRTENTIKEYPSFEGVGQSYVDGKQDLLIYSVPEKNQFICNG